MNARQDHRAEVQSYAKEAFKDHVLEAVSRDDKGKPYAWVCMKPGTGIYRFWVMEGPGCIAQWGDVGGLMIAQGSSYKLPWLEGSVGSLDYVLGKSKFTKSEFVTELFQAYLSERRVDASDAGKPLDFKLEHGGDEEDMRRYYEETGDYEVGECSRDWPADALWAYFALEKFIELLKKGRDVRPDESVAPA